MCGIAGFLGGYERQVLSAMGARIRHRGPDDGGIFFDAEAGAGLVHCRLSILDLSPTGHQPMSDRSGRFDLCYNGEVYNYVELRAELIGRGVTFRGTSDTEVILELLALDGLAALPRLNGIFAFALWDRQLRQMHLVRDGLGVKPLYWTRTPAGFAFSSELKALLELPDLDRELDPIAAVQYLSYLYTPGERTMLAKVKKLAPGTCVTFRRGAEPRVDRFYDLPLPQADNASPESFVPQMREMLDRAVARQMRSDVQVGAFLSGGLDSSAIVASARQHAAGGKLPCFTIDYAAEDGEAGELIPDLPFARRAAQHLGVELHEVRVNGSMAADFADLVTMLDEPQADPAALNNYYISRLAREAGIKVLLSGAGGDDLLTGYRRHQAAGFTAAVGRLPRFCRQAVGQIARKLPLSHPHWRRARKALEHVGEGEIERLARMFEWLDPEQSAELLSDVENAAALAKAARAPMLAAASEDGLHTALDRTLRMDQRHFLTDHNLNYTDKTGMATGVEIRVPFLDHELVDWAARLPARAKIQGMQTKWVLRKAMEPILPREIIYRPKTGFGVPLRSWMNGAMRPMIDELLSRSVLESRGLFEPAAVDRLREATRLGHIDSSYSLLGIASIELWCRSFIDR